MSNKRRFVVTKTFDVITPESASRGDFAETGTEFDNVLMSLAQLVNELRGFGYFERTQDLDWSQSFAQVDPEVDYSTGAETRYTLHIEGAPEHMKRLLLFVKGGN